MWIYITALVISILCVMLFMYKKEGYTNLFDDYAKPEHRFVPMQTECKRSVDPYSPHTLNYANTEWYRNKISMQPNTSIPHKTCLTATTSPKLHQHQWETRTPVMVGHKHSYVDEGLSKYVYDRMQPVTDKARLTELPLNLKNVYTAKIDPQMYNTDYYLLNY